MKNTFLLFTFLQASLLYVSLLLYKHFKELNSFFLPFVLAFIYIASMNFTQQLHCSLTNQVTFVYC